MTLPTSKTDLATRISNYIADLEAVAEVHGNYANNPYAAPEHAIQALERERTMVEIAGVLRTILAAGNDNG